MHVCASLGGWGTRHNVHVVEVKGKCCLFQSQAHQAWKSGHSVRLCLPSHHRALELETCATLPSFWGSELRPSGFGSRHCRVISCPSLSLSSGANKLSLTLPLPLLPSPCLFLLFPSTRSLPPSLPLKLLYQLFNLFKSADSSAWGTRDG